MAERTIEKKDMRAGRSALRTPAYSILPVDAIGLLSDKTDPAY
jgi:hypothetical protein